MPITADFEYTRVKDLKEALELKSEYGKGARVLAGGTDLLVHLKENPVSPRLLLDLKSLGELNRIQLKNGTLKIGANVTFAELIESALVRKNFPILWEAAMTVASVGVRNRATMAGNICSAVPSADAASPLLVYEAEVSVLNRKDARVIPMNDWFTGPKKTSLKEDEIVESVELKIPEKKHSGCYLKLSRYEGEDLAQGALSVLMNADKTFRVAAAALAPTPRRAFKTESYLKGKKITQVAAKEAGKLLLGEISPISDIRSSKEYRLHMASVMLERGLEKAVKRFFSDRPDYGEGMIV